MIIKKENLMKMNKIKSHPERDFFCGLIKFNYGQKVEAELKKISDKIDWARGWPETKKSFWNVEAFMWQHKIEKEKRELIKRELKWLGKGRNLDLGCGSYSYLPSIGFDISDKMLQFNENLVEKIVGDLEQQLPFDEASFDSVTAIFVLNYVQNYSLLISEINRVLKLGGKFVMVISAHKINDWQRQKTVNSFSVKKWVLILNRAGFKVRFYRKDNLFFVQCQRPLKNGTVHFVSDGLAKKAD